MQRYPAIHPSKRVPAADVPVGAVCYAFTCGCTHTRVAANINVNRAGCVAFTVDNSKCRFYHKDKADVFVGSSLVYYDAFIQLLVDSFT